MLNPILFGHCVGLVSILRQGICFSFVAMETWVWELGTRDLGSIEEEDLGFPFLFLCVYWIPVALFPRERMMVPSGVR